ncbi:MAG: peptidoglycan DD-metalloendopeptidase family protein [bacterium]|nr:peptidoglycan DD-metalloendopeptidase family protein [bacterium]
MRLQQTLSTLALTFIWGLLLVSAARVQAAETQSTGDEASQQLERLRKEISDFEKRISESQHKEKNLLQDLEDFNREIGLRAELMRKLEAERNRAQQGIEATQRELQSLGSEIGTTRRDSLNTASERDSLVSLVVQRAIYTYKYYRRDLLKLILTSRSTLQLLTRQEYLKRIAEADRRNLTDLDRKNQKLAAINLQLTSRQSTETNRLQRQQELARYKEQLLTEENSEAQQLKRRRQERESLLKRIRQDRELLKAQLAEKKEAAERVESLIKNLETRRESQPPPPTVAWAPEIPFEQLRGKMNWPTLGKVVTYFGLQKHEKLATVTENPGIEIEAEEGTPVRAVCTGQVTKITWLRGYGNTIIVDHRDGYYTVYAHLSQLNVREGQVVKAGELIGSVGQTGSLSGPRLHFEIWVKRQKQDPIAWLTKR